MTGNIELNEVATISNNVTIDLNGYKTTTTASDTFQVNSCATLMIQDSSTGASGLIESGSDDAVVLSGGSLVLNSDTIKRTSSVSSPYAPVIGSTGTFTMNGGSVVVEEATTVTYNGKGVDISAVQVGTFMMSDNYAIVEVDYNNWSKQSQSVKFGTNSAYEDFKTVNSFSNYKTR